jgi:catechol 2,3-dioxygenase-like lactoylglutathione lyase family enzyme
MKRFHVHVAVDDLAASTRFYSALFGLGPTVLKDDYAKWQLDDPRVNFAISQRGNPAGVNHLGIQTDDDAELETLRARLDQAEVAAVAEHGVACCYARSNKYWVTDPTGLAWETFHTLGAVPTFDGAAADAPASAACCTPADRVADAAAATAPVVTACCAPVEAPAAAACCAPAVAVPAKIAVRPRNPAKA